jgi:DNA-binding IclR family transcriptional regulator
MEAVLERAFRLLDAFDARRSVLTLAELSEASGLPRSTAHRLAVQLEQLKALERTRQGWRVGVRMFEYGQLACTQRRLRELALAHMEDLYEATHETIHLATLDGADIVYVEILSGHRKVRTPSRRGGRMPAHCTALGKVLLAFRPDGEPLPPAPLAARTAATIVDPSALQRELHTVRRTALAYDRQEAMDGLVCVAAPVIGPGRRGVAEAALSVSMSADGPLTPEQVGPAVRLAALALSRDLAGV